MAPRAAHYLAGVLALQAIFAVVIAVLSSTTLQQGGACLLNLSGGGDICDFLAITSYFSLFFGLLMAAGTASTLRSGPGAFLAPVNGSVACFGAMFWLAAAVMATQRGKQAGDAGMPEASARNAVMVLSWFEFALYLVAVAAVAFDLIARKRLCLPADRTAPMLSGPPSDVESAQLASEFKQAAYEAPHTAHNLQASAHT